MTDDRNFDEAYNKLAGFEGGYTTGKNQIRDEPTNMGITQSTLDNYAAAHPGANLAADVRDLTVAMARQIYKEMYWDNTRIPQIQNSRIRNAVFDMCVMSGPTIPTRTLQQTLNAEMGTTLPRTGYLGEQTIKAINSIPESEINRFMGALIENRLRSLQGMKNWPTARGGWTRRTRTY